MREGNGKYFGDRVNDYIQERETRKERSRKNERMHDRVRARGR